MHLFVKTAVIACAVLASGGAAAASADDASDTSSASLSDFVCRSGDAAADRQISVTATMRPQTAPQHLAIRATLMERDGQGTRPVSGGRLDRWITPQDATLGERPDDQWIVRLPVTGLAVGERYRLRVDFRWSDDGGVVASATRWSPACVERG